MAPKSRAPEKTSNTAPSASKSSKSGSLDAQEIVQSVWNKYVEKTPQRVKLLDSFMVFLIVVGVLQFAYCLIVGNFVSTNYVQLHFAARSSQLLLSLEVLLWWSLLVRVVN